MVTKKIILLSVLLLGNCFSQEVRRSNKPLFSAILNKDLPRVQTLLDSGFNVHSSACLVTWYGKSIYAVEGGGPYDSRRQRIRLLFPDFLPDDYIDDERDSDGELIFGFFAKRRFLNALPERLTEDITAIDCALINEDKKMVKFLLGKGGKAQMKYLILHDDPKMVDMFLKQRYASPYEIAVAAAQNSKNKIVSYLSKRCKFDQEQQEQLKSLSLNRNNSCALL